MFGLIISGRAPRLDATQMEPTKFLFAPVDAIGDACLFMTQPLPEDQQAVVFINQNSDWHAVGRLTVIMPSLFFTVPFEGVHGIGVSIEPFSGAETALISFSARASIPSIIKVAESAFNYLQSFSKPLEAFSPGTQVVPMRAIQDWYQVATRKAQLDSKWLARE